MMSHMGHLRTSALRDAIDRLYDVFASYRSERPWVACDDCVSEAENQRLHAIPLRELTPDQVGRYAFKAMTTWGTPEDFRHFLPRIFELLAADGGGSWIDAEVAFGKLSYGDWHEWPADERETIRQYLRSLWAEVLATYPHPFCADSCLCSIAVTGDEMSPYVAAWDVGGRSTHARHFAAFVAWNVRALDAKRGRWDLTNRGWWDKHPASARQVTDWLLERERVDELERAFFAFSGDPAVAGELSEAFNNLGTIQLFGGVQKP